MTKWPRIRAKAVIAALRKAGFEVVRVRGSHHILRHADGRRTVIPVHSGEDIGPGLLRRILTEAELTKEQFDALR